MSSSILAALLCGSLLFGHAENKQEYGREICRRLLADCFKYQKDRDCLDLDKEQWPFEKTKKPFKPVLWSTYQIIHRVTDCKLYAPLEYQGGGCGEPNGLYWRNRK